MAARRLRPIAPQGALRGGARGVQEVLRALAAHPRAADCRAAGRCPDPPPAEQGRIYASTYQEVGEFRHSSLLAGKPVTGAGELVVENGVVKLISNKSGHYQPTAAMNEQVIKSLEAQA